MKVLFISQYFYPEVFKGNEIVFDFAQKGYDITVLTGKPNYPKGEFYEGYSFFGKKEETIKGVKIIRTPLFPRKSGKSIPLILNYLSFIWFSYFTVLFRIKEKYDVIFIQQLSPVTMALPGLWVKKKQKTPIILWVLDLWPESVIATTSLKKGKIIDLIEKLVRNIYAKSDVILVSSKSFIKSIQNKCENLNKDIQYFPNWAEDVFVNVRETSIEIPELPKGFNVMFAGNVGESQDFEAILDAAEKTKDKEINWVIVGDGRKLNWVKKEIKERSLNNVFPLGRYPLETMPHFFKEADAMLVALKDTPVFGITVPAKIQAYMASGKMILGMINGEGKDLINESKCGYAVAAEDSSSLSEKAIKLLNLSKKERNKMETNALEYYQNNFSKDNLFSKLENIFQNYSSS
ncbi:glycosyltransferase family 4 protein [Maribacter sp. ANRC-HE7]|uniref:Glycosyltransferase family 4 protein n=1 Tax=Maribacter aquimaris TaxID=2737171 RepID=A0ABR7V1X7_9FLAO|nr:glycosyltransferase family 4 protein [Maribacter aquimaris]MBD0778827.1 glycosyltransferase family 4 protein [Maribacter aquimaris]